MDNTTSNMPHGVYYYHGRGKELDNTNQLFTSSQQVVAAQKKTIDAQDAQIAGQVKACQTEVDTVKSQARKGKIKWFFIGYVAGFISGRVVLPVK